MITCRGANLGLCQDDVPSALLDGADLLHHTGYTFFAPGPRAVALGLIAEAVRRTIPFTVDPGSAAFLAALAPGEFLAWTGPAAVCFPNREEAAVIAAPPRTAQPGAAPPGTAQPGADAREPLPDAAGLAETLARHYGVVALKLGADGALIAAAGARPVHVPAAPSVVRDTTGAGDAFCAGFLAAWLTGTGLETAAASGARAAARAVATLGGRPERE